MFSPKISLRRTSSLRNVFLWKSFFFKRYFRQVLYYHYYRHALFSGHLRYSWKFTTILYNRVQHPPPLPLPSILFFSTLYDYENFKSSVIFWPPPPTEFEKYVPSECVQIMNIEIIRAVIVVSLWRRFADCDETTGIHFIIFFFFHSFFHIA